MNEMRIVEKEASAREVLLAVTAVCSMPESDAKRDLMHEFTKLLAKINHPIVMIHPQSVVRP